MNNTENRLSHLLSGLDLIEIEGPSELIISSLTFHHQEVEAGGLFFAIPGAQVDGHEFICSAISAGAIAIVCEKIPQSHPGTTFIRVVDSRRALGFIASKYYNSPSSRLCLVGITGTNGKTTSVTWLYHVSQFLGHKAGLFSTVRNEIDGKVIPATHTTPDALQLNRLMLQMVESGCTHCFMEVSSHAIHQNRIAGLCFAGGVFTNLTHDHLDYHGTMESYFHVKKRFFDDLPKDAFALTNKDDPRGLDIIADCQADIKKTYSLSTDADYRAELIELSMKGMQLRINSHNLTTQLLGQFNVYNLTEVWGVCDLLGYQSPRVATFIKDLKPVEGRYQWLLSEDGIFAVVDFAHTPDALRNVLTTTREIRPSGRIVTVFGCGGNKDREKRPHMGKLAAELSDYVIVTSDNPRTENPIDIIADICRGITIQDFKAKVTVISERNLAIQFARAFVKPGDSIVLAGRGHEKYQEILDERIPFYDMDALRSVLLDPVIGEGRRN